MLTGSTKKFDLNLVFDGGSLGNPGKGYGSFHLSSSDGFEVLQRLEFGDNVTNNQAEYRTFIAGIEAAISHADGNGTTSRSQSISIRTDSKLVVEQVNGRWKVKHPDLQPLCRRARELLSRFGASELTWHPRAESVKLLGH